MNESIGVKLLQVIRHYGLNMHTFSAKLAGVNYSTITKIIKDETKGMSLEVAVAILKGYPEISPDWFLCGTGEMLRENRPMNDLAPAGPCKECADKDKQIVLLEKLVLSLENNLNDLRQKP